MADTARRPSQNAVALVVLLALVGGLLLWQRPWHDDTPDTEPGAYPADPAAALTLQVAKMSRAGSEDELADASGSPEWAAQVWAAREALGVDDVRWRYVTGGEEPTFDDGDTRATVEVTWEDGSTPVDLRLRPDAKDFTVVSALGSDDPLPLWLAGDLTLDRAGDVTVARIDGGDATLDVERAAAIARRTVEDTLGPIDRPLVIISPDDEAGAAAVLGQDRAAIERIAAVSTGLDRREGDLAGAVVVLNPGVFADMDARARQVVLAHEATHVLSGSVGSRIETWVAEGFADFVALHDDGASLDVSAGQILAQVRDQGAPERLPTQQDFDGATVGLGAIYESAWMIFRLLGERYGDDAVLDFYDAVLGGEPVADAVPEAFGISVAQLTKDWQASLVAAAKG